MREIRHRLTAVYWRLRVFLQRYGYRCVLAETLRRLGLNALCGRLLTTAIPTFQAWQKLAKTPPEDVAGVKVSVIIPVYNGIADGLERLLDSLRQQSHRNLEIVAVDSGSSDQSVALLQRHGATIVQIPKAEFRHDYARNLGAENATGDFLLFTVCDCSFEDPQWIELGLRHLKQFAAVSYSTPQSYDEGAEAYARYLALNFLTANRYKLGVNLFGNRLFGRLAFALAGRTTRERTVHVDDTNHLVRRDFFLEHRYTAHTCEDMSFGREVICAGRRFVYSTLSQVQHYHNYANYKKYFTRVLVDLMATNEFLGPYKVRGYHDIVDTTISSAALLLGAILKTLHRYEHCSVRRVDLRSNVSTEILEKRGLLGLSDFNNTLYARTPLSYVLDIKSLVEEVRPVLDQQVGLCLDQGSQRLDPKHFRGFQSTFRLHIKHACWTLTKLGYVELSLDEFRHFVTLCMLNALAADLSLWVQRDRNEDSVNVEALKQLKWM